MNHHAPRRSYRSVALLLSIVGLCFGGRALWAIVGDLGPVAALHEAKAEHVEQSELLALVQAKRFSDAFNEAFEAGDELFETEFNALDGVGANVGDGSRFTRVPRADLTGPGQWAAHTPSRATGPNAVSCNACHVQLFDDGSGSAVGNVHRDPQHSGNLRRFIQRNTPHVFALGALQRLAEEMTTDLLQQRDTAARQACSFGTGTSQLVTKGVAFGSIKAIRGRAAPSASATSCAVTYDTSNVVGVSTDLVVRPFQWKGINATVREFNRDAANNEIGMQAVEFVGDGIDGDSDGVVNELGVGDITALTIYLSAQPRPTTNMELAQWGLIDPLSAQETKAIEAGAKVFSTAGCATCHTPRMLLNDPIFNVPSKLAQYRDATFPAGQNPVALGVDPNFPVSFDLTKDQPDNRLQDASGRVVFALGSFVRDRNGRAVIDLFSDLKRHNMGTRLAESIDEAGTGAATFLTRTLWGVGSTAPYLHDGRATTLTEAILEHGGEAAASRALFTSRPLADQQALIAYLNNLVLFKMTEGQVVVPPPRTVRLNPALTLRRTGR